MNKLVEAKYAVSRAGLNRSMVIRRLIRLGHPRLRRLRARALEGADPLSRVLSLCVRGLEQGVLRVPQGRAAGLTFEMKTMTVAHAHLGAIAFGNLENEVQEAMARHLARGATFYDIGANLGFFSLLGAHMVGLEDGRVYAFEAAPDNAEAIRRNAQKNGIGNVVVIAKAVSAQQGKARLQVVDDQSWSKLEDYGEHPYTEQVIEVETVAIDDLLANGEAAPPTVVKIDVEGAELAVLEGMRCTISEHRPAIICELHETHREFADLMKGHGYRLINLHSPAPIEQAGPSAHALALPPENLGD